MLKYGANGARFRRIFDHVRFKMNFLQILRDLFKKFATVGLCQNPLRKELTLECFGCCISVEASLTVIDEVKRIEKVQDQFIGRYCWLPLRKMTRSLFLIAFKRVMMVKSLLLRT